MSVVVNTLSVQTGDREITLDTSTKAARRKLEGIIKRKLREGAAVLFEFMGETYRVKRYDPQRDELVVFARKVTKGARIFRISAAKAKITVVAPISGG